MLLRETWGKLMKSANTVGLGLEFQERLDNWACRSVASGELEEAVHASC